MKQRDLIAAGAGLAVGGDLLAAQGNSPTRPNLLFIMTDQQRFDALSMAGNTVLETPNMDRIAVQGVYFENCYTQGPICGPARSSLMTGRTVENSRVRSNMDADDADRIPMPSYDELLADRGYATEFWDGQPAEISNETPRGVSGPVNASCENCRSQPA